MKTICIVSTVVGCVPLSFLSCSHKEASSGEGEARIQEAVYDGPFGEVSEDFSGLLSVRAERTKAETVAVLGSSYESRPAEQIAKVQSEIESTGRFDGYDFGNNLFRITTIAEAEMLLSEVWPQEDFSDGSVLSALFQRYPHASVALMEADDQRILFFGKDERLVFFYPQS